MNTSRIKAFAPEVRRQLMEAVMRKLDYVLTADTPDLRQAAAQVTALRREASKDRHVLIERVAYTWFNRLAALRFLDARGWHPFMARVLTAATPNETQPELLKLVRTGSLPDELRPHIDLSRLNDILDGRLPTSIAGADPQGEVYRHIVLGVCHFYHASLPFLFERIDDETELLLPDDILTATSVAEGFRTEITDDDCGEVEIIGWLYQFYISEKKDAVMARKAAVPEEDIPAVTQLFTPHWIVRYLVENSLGRLWLLNRPNSRLREHMPYYIEGEPGRDFLKITKAEEIRVCDPAVGSGHMLTYAFDLLTLIYEEEGYSPTEIPSLVLRHNLCGLEICPRAAQLAELALVFKAREKSRRFFQPEHIVQPGIIELREVSFAENELPDYIRALGLGDLFHQPLLKLLHQFKEAKNFGLLIQPCLEERTIAEVRRAIEGKDLGGQLFLRETHLKVLRVLEQAEALTQRYHVVVANPPYMGSKAMNPELKKFVKGSFGLGDVDIYASFIERGFNLLVPLGQLGFITMHSWMFLAKYQNFRTKLLSCRSIASLVHLGAGAFSTIGGAVVQTVAFSATTAPPAGNKPTCFRLLAGDEQQKHRAFLARERMYVEFCQTDFLSLPGKPVAYWCSRKAFQVFASAELLESVVYLQPGLQTCENARFLRRWQEVSASKSSLGGLTQAEATNSGKKWFGYTKGGEFRKWYGSLDLVVNWANNGEEIKEIANQKYPYLNGKTDYVIKDRGYYFKSGVSWTVASADTLGVRFLPPGLIFDCKASSCFPSEAEQYWLLAFLASRVTQYFLDLQNPGIDVQAGNIGSLPLVSKDVMGDHIRLTQGQLARDAVSIAGGDWDNFETSWGFRDQPLLRPGLKNTTLGSSWENWEAQSTSAIRRMQELETENNRLFISAYGLDGELQPEITEEQITLARAEVYEDAAAFVSYAVGCIMGRYSTDRLGLILADAESTNEDFHSKVPNPAFKPDPDGIVPVLDGEWFTDDVVARTREFISLAWGEKHLEENVAWLEEALGKDLRKYFLTDFYKNHFSNERAYGYKKRPIYWLFQSPNKGFSALVYLHRYTKDTCNTLLNDYLREYLHKLEARIAHLAHIESTSTVAKEKTGARKEADKLRKTLKECQNWERDILLPLAQQRIELDLDDGVKVNYQKFPGALAVIPGLASKDED